MVTVGKEAVPLVPTPLTFPALCVPRDFGVYLVRDLAQLRQCRAQLFWRYRHFEGLRIYDSHGEAYEVTAARVSKPASKVGRFLARLLDVMITVDVEIAPIGSASLSEVVSAVQRAIEVDPESFEELSGRSVGWWRATLADARSLRSVIRAFGSTALERSRDA